MKLQYKSLVMDVMSCSATLEDGVLKVQATCTIQTDQTAEDVSVMLNHSGGKFAVTSEHFQVLGIPPGVAVVAAEVTPGDMADSLNVRLEAEGNLG